jgi:hypothetical protein
LPVLSWAGVLGLFWLNGLPPCAGLFGGLGGQVGGGFSKVAFQMPTGRTALNTKAIRQPPPRSPPPLPRRIPFPFTPTRQPSSGSSNSNKLEKMSGLASKQQSQKLFEKLKTKQANKVWGHAVTFPK